MALSARIHRHHRKTVSTHTQHWHYQHAYTGTTERQRLHTQRTALSARIHRHHRKTTSTHTTHGIISTHTPAPQKDNVYTHNAGIISTHTPAPQKDNVYTHNTRHYQHAYTGTTERQRLHTQHTALSARTHRHHRKTMSTHTTLALSARIHRHHRKTTSTHTTLALSARIHRHHRKTTSTHSQHWHYQHAFTGTTERQCLHTQQCHMLHYAGILGLTTGYRSAGLISSSFPETF